MTKAYLYVLYCNDQTLYTGYSTDIVKRLLTHRKKQGAKYTRISKRHPLKLCYLVEYPNKSAALKAEYAFKQLQRSQKIKIITQQQKQTFALLKTLPNNEKITIDMLKFF